MTNTNRLYNYPIGPPELIFYEDENQYEEVYPSDFCDRDEDDEINWLLLDQEEWYQPEGFVAIEDTDFPF